MVVAVNRINQPYNTSLSCAS